LISIKQPIDNVDKFHGQKIGILKQGINRTRGGESNMLDIVHQVWCCGQAEMWCGKTDSERSGVGSPNGLNVWLIHLQDTHRGGLKSLVMMQ
jgi:hypothetical protein